mmetsp:Transcript_11370/g.14781  ORF Transcript_11370/g.14781 Transcript_11370/m.14781 type:complete len:167 (-) Transcript_11370:36-536(-)
MTKNLWLTMALSSARHLQHFEALSLHDLFEVMKDSNFHDFSEPSRQQAVTHSSHHNVPFQVPKDSRILLLKGALTVDEDMMTWYKAICYFENLEGEVFLKDGSVFFVFPANVVSAYEDKISSNRFDVHSAVNVAKDHEVVNRNTQRFKGKLLGRAPELQQEDSRFV